MYPVISLLRRCAATQVFVRPDLLERVEGRFWLRLRSPSSFLDLTKGSWGLTHDKVPMFEMRVSAKSSEAAAMSLVKKENKLAEAMKATQTLYTLALGPETESEKDGQVTRIVRLTVVRGVYRASGTKVLETAPLKGVVGRKFPRPKGVKFDEL